MSLTYKYDVFISYSHKDSDWVKNRLVPNLEAHGYTVMVDFRDFVSGSMSVEEMQRGVEESKHVICVLTEAYVNSEWTKFENAMAQTVNPGASQRKIIPILLAPCAIPLRLSILHYRNLTNDDLQQWNLLMRDLI